MVFVGPRPIAPGLQEHLEEHIPGFAARLGVHPGLTSLGQVCIDENAPAERVVQDWSVRFEGERHYLANRSIAYDLIVIVMTIVFCLRKLLRRLQWSTASALVTHALAGRCPAGFSVRPEPAGGRTQRI
jgi:lipopolysaccharide/colanic/teichoic acid biosynthesis glycosyltransferase